MHQMSIHAFQYCKEEIAHERIISWVKARPLPFCRCYCKFHTNTYNRPSITFPFLVQMLVQKYCSAVWNRHIRHCTTTPLSKKAWRRVMIRSTFDVYQNTNAATILGCMGAR